MIQILSQRYGVEGVGVSMQGGRQENQDDLGYAETPLGFLIIVCDGMGGGPGGKTASHIVKTVVIETLCNSSAMASPADAFKMAVSRANDALEERMAQVPELKGMGSTMVAALINDQQATIVHLGDSRCYRLRNNKMVFRTKDHSLVGELVQNGALTEEQARTSPQSNVITRGLGSTTNHVAEIDEVPFRQGDRFVLCTDGVWGIMPHTDLLLRFTAQQDIGSTVRNLSAEIDKIGESHGNNHDNHTLAIVEVKKDSIKKDPMKIQTKILLYAGLLALAVSLIFNVVSYLRLGADSNADALQSKADSLLTLNENLEEALAEMSYQKEAASIAFEQKLTELQNNSASVSKKERIDWELREKAYTSKVDSLQNVIKTLRATQSQKPAAVKAADNNSKDISAMSDMELTDYLITQFLTYKNATAKSEEAVRGVQNVCKREIEKALTKLEENKNLTRACGKIQKYLDEDDAFNATKNVWVNDSKTSYYASDRTKKLIDREIIPLLQKFKERI